MPVKYSKIITICLATISLFVTGAAPAQVAKEDWQWVQVSPRDYYAYPVKWTILKGVAKNVKFTGSTFSADLFGDDLDTHPQSAQIATLRGKIQNGKITATLVILNADSNSEQFSGIVTKIKKPAEKWETDRITLVDGDLGNRSWIGLTRLLVTQ